MPRSRLYPFFGLGLALLAPVGLLVVRAVAAGQVPTFAWSLADIERIPETYAYVGLSTVGVFAVLGCVLGRSFDRVQRLSITDPLTGLFNRRHFEHRVAEEVGRGWRQGYATCVLCVDIDRLKAINDAFGHRGGDRAIVAVGRILAKSVRTIDTVARMGGDEFAVLLPETSAPQASALSRRILKEVARHSDASTGSLAISIGIVERHVTTEMESDDMLAAGDAALYRVKAAGGGHAAFALAGPRPAAIIDDVVDGVDPPVEPDPRPAVRGPSGSVTARWRLWGQTGTAGPMSRSPDGQRIEGNRESPGGDEGDGNADQGE